MGGNKRPRKKMNGSKKETLKSSHIKEKQRGKKLIYIIIAMSLVGTGFILYLV